MRLPNLGNEIVRNKIILSTQADNSSHINNEQNKAQNVSGQCDPLLRIFLGFFGYNMLNSYGGHLLDEHFLAFDPHSS